MTTPQRRDVLEKKGENSNLIKRLLKDAEQWTQFRSILQKQVDVARTFRTKYSDLDYEDGADNKAPDGLEKAIDNFAEKVKERITQLDEASQLLIQIVSMLTIPTHHSRLLCAIPRNHLQQRLSADMGIGI